jgi:outer membrane protein assembly factor BamD
MPRTDRAFRFVPGPETVPAAIRSGRLNPGEMAAYPIGYRTFFGYRFAVARLGAAAGHQTVHAMRLRVFSWRGADTASQASGFKSMSARRMTLKLRILSARPDSHWWGRQLRLAASLAVLATPLSGCGTGALWDKFFAKDDTFVEQPADKLYNEGLYLMNQKNEPKEASKKFEEVDRQHPYSEWARKSLLMSAYAYYKAGDYDNCIGSATRYVTLHPGNPDAAYAQFLIASSQYDQIPDTSRDQGRTEKAIAALEEVVRKYPTSEYAVSAKAKLEGARDQLAGKEMNVGRYYMQKRDYTAAINRFKTVVTQYQTTRHVEEALERLTEAYMAIGIVGEAQTAAAVLGHNFPDSRWYKDAYNLVKSGGLEPSENQGSYISRAFKKMGLG